MSSMIILEEYKLSQARGQQGDFRPWSAEEVSVATVALRRTQAAVLVT